MADVTELRNTSGAHSGTTLINLAGGISRLRGAIQRGKVIFAADINELTLLVNTMMGHHHPYWDVQQVPSFGNTGNRTQYDSYKNTSSGVAGYGTAQLGDISRGGVITASTHNGLANHTRRLSSHYHTFSDDYIL